jgi:hypothetical protein
MLLESCSSQDVLLDNYLELFGHGLPEGTYHSIRCENSAALVTITSYLVEIRTGYISNESLKLSPLLSPARGVCLEVLMRSEKTLTMIRTMNLRSRTAVLYTRRSVCDITMSHVISLFLDDIIVSQGRKFKV